MRMRMLVNSLIVRPSLLTCQRSVKNRCLFSTSCHLQNVTSSNGFLREAYHCDLEWNKRLEHPILKNISSLDDFFYDIDKRYQTDKVISAVDVDLYVNKVAEEENLEELEELIYRLRRSPATADTLPSTGYAAIRALLKAGKHSDIMRILNDRWNYGVFVDSHLANILMDEFLKQGNNRDAAKVASLLMLEEDFGPSTSQYFALVSCLAYLQNPSPDPWDSNLPKESKEDEEEVKVRLAYIRNPYFDDHFDLTNPHHLIGKTLSLLSDNLKNDDEVLASSVKLLGLALHGKWNKVESFLQKSVSNKRPLAKEVIAKVSELCEAASAEIESSPSKTLPKPKVHQYPGVNLDEKNVTAMWQQLNYPEQEKYVPLVKTILGSGKVTSADLNLHVKAKELLSSALSEREEVEIQDQIQAYEKWNERRILELDNQMKRFRKFEVTESIEARKKDLKEKEEVIFFFDNEEEWMMRLPPDQQKGYTLSTEYIPRNYEKFVRCVPPKKNLKKKKKE